MNGSETIYPKAELLPFEPELESGLLQPYGVLLVVSNDASLTILQISENASEYFNISLPDLLNQSLASLLDPVSIDLIQQLPIDSHSICPFPLLLRAATPQQWEGRLHRQQNLIFLELEPANTTAAHLFDSQHRLRSAIHKLQQVSSLTGFLQLAAEQISALIEFDRVMVYQFDPQGAGEVVAEASSDLAYLGLHYPASDIPEQPRRLYAQGLLRYIPDLTAAEVGLIPAINPLTQAAPDLSFVLLRGTDPCCVEYHQNMGVGALMVIALVKDRQLWGLISCHHRTPKQVTGAVRMTCELLGQFVAAELANKVNYEELDYMMRLKSLQSEFIESIAEADNLKTALVYPAPRILDLVSAQGVAVCLEDEITLIGETPALEQIQALIQWADQQHSEALFHTDALPKLYPAAADFKQTASGLLLLRISQVRRYYILWFRPEVQQTVNWAGNPLAAAQVGADGQLVLSPRHSFAQWQEIVQFTALPWKPSELENALDLRHAIVGIVLSKADELAQMNRALARSNRELESFAYAASHDLKEPLRGIHNYATFLVEDYAEQIDEAGIDRLRTLVKLTQRMESLIDVLLKFSQLGQTEVNRQPTNLNELLRQVINIFRISHPGAAVEIRIPRQLPTVEVDPVLISEVFSNLLNNAYKYNDKANPWVELGYLDPDDPLGQAAIQDLSTGIPARTSTRNPSTTVLYVRDNGIGIRDRHLETIFRLFKRLHPQTMYGGGTGAGLTIAKKIVERHNGQIWVKSTYGEGSVFYLTLE